MDAVVAFGRGGHAESEHRVAWCLTDAAGRVVSGDGELVTFMRSASKPFQALPAVRAGVLGQLGLEDRHLALACASHGGGAEHVDAVEEMLGAAGLRESDLELGPLEPRDPAVAATAAPATRLTHNCSGKHAFALGYAVAAGHATSGYIDSRHPVQRAMRAAVAEATGGEPRDLRRGTDGCGMCTYLLPLRGIATAFARLASGGLGEAGERLCAAMRAHPGLVAYAGAIDTELMAAEDGVVAKVGAEGVLGVGLADGRGLALKVRDGAMRAIDPAAVLLAREVLGLSARSPALARLAHPAIRNSRGEVVGETTARL